MSGGISPRHNSVVSSPGSQREIFISCSELQKDALARPFRALLATNGLRGVIVSDAPRPGAAWTPEEKVDAYLARSEAVVVFATADIAAHDDVYTRPNIADEIARARSKPHLRDRVCVLKQRGVELPSNINPAYEQLDPARPVESFRRALVQLREWGFAIANMRAADSAVPGDTVSGSPRDTVSTAADLPVADQDVLLARADALVPDDRHTTGEMSLAVVIAAAAPRPVLRPAELEAPTLHRQLTQLLLFGEPALFEPNEATNAAMSGDSLVIRQARGWVALDAHASLVIVRPLYRRAERGLGMSAVIEEQVRSDIEDALQFADQLLSAVDPRGLVSHLVPVAALVGAQYGGWRTAAEHAASPTSMAMNIDASRRPVVHLSPPALARGSLSAAAAEAAEDLTVLLRRAVTTRS